MKKLLVLSLALTSFAVHADDIRDSNISAGLMNTAPQKTTATPQNTQAPTINQGAKTGEDSQKSGQMMNMMASAMLMSQCMSSDPPNMMLCAMGAMAALQGAHDSGAADQSNQTYTASLADTNSGGTNQIATADPDSLNAGFQTATIDKGLKALASNGYAVSEAGMTLPDGTLVPASAMTSASAMSAAGVDPKMATEAAAALAKVNAKLEEVGGPKMSLAVDGSGGGYTAPSSSNHDDWSFNLKNPWNLSKSAKAKMVEGKSVNLAGEPIGVKGDNLFEMVHRAYDKKVKSANFIESDSRRPASVRSSK